MPFTGRELRSTIAEDGRLSLSLVEAPVGEPEDDEVVVRIEAAPINPSDLALLLGPADLSTMTRQGGDRPGLDLIVPKDRLGAVRGRLGQSLAVGNEGAGLVVAAGQQAKALEGRRVGTIGGGMFADYRRVKAREVALLPAGATSADGAAMFVNPLTALGFIETARREGHTAMVHTAAASNLGQMLQKVCLADGIPLVNIVRSQKQADILRGLGARYVVDSSDETFATQLVDAIAETGATVAFDAIGGGTLGGRIVQAMEQAAAGRETAYSRYGTDVFKQLYIYGALDLAPTTLDRLAFGFQWSVSGWLLMPFLRKVGLEAAARMRQRVTDELMTTFASRYTRVIGLAEALDPEILRAYERKATGEKFLIDPTKG